MIAPNELTKEDKATWNKLFELFEPRNPVEIEMAKRYIVWFNLFEKEQALVAVKGTTQTKQTYKGGETVGKSDHFDAMKVAEDQMRRLWDVLAKRMTEPKTKNENKFSKL